MRYKRNQVNIHGETDYFAKCIRALSIKRSLCIPAALSCTETRVIGSVLAGLERRTEFESPDRGHAPRRTRLADAGRMLAYL